MSEAFLAASWLGPKSGAAERSLTNRSALARSPAKVRGLDMLVEVLSTPSHRPQTLSARPRAFLPIASINVLWFISLSLNFSTPFESASVTCSSSLESC